jgi:hypothetical protein
VYVADQANNRVRMISTDPLTGAVTVSTLAGNGVSGHEDAAAGSPR